MSPMVERAYLLTLFWSHSTWDIWDAVRWNELTINLLMQIYFPLLRHNNMRDYGDHVCAGHMAELLLESKRYSIQSGGASSYPDLEDRIDRLNVHYRSSLAELTEYLVRDCAENENLWRRDVRKKSLDSLTAEDRYRLLNADYCERYVTDANPPEVRLPRVGDRVKVIADIVGAYYIDRSNGCVEKVKGGDILVIAKCEKVTDYYRIIYQSNRQIPMRLVSGIGFQIKQNISLEYLRFDVKPVYRVSRPGKNVYQDLVARNKDFLGFRIKPLDLATIIALRFLDIVTSQQARTLVELLWEDWSVFDVFDHIENNKMLSDNSIDLKELLNNVLEQNQKAVADYRSGNKQALGHLMGIAMKSLKGQANGSEIKSLLEKAIEQQH